MNVAYDVKRDTGSQFLFKSAASYIRGESEGDLTTDRLAFDARVDRKLNTSARRCSARCSTCSDEFKQIDYLVSPTVGIAQQLVKNDRTEFAVDGGLGHGVGKEPRLRATTDGALTAGQNFKHKLTTTAEVTQRTAALWKMDDFDDGLYIFGVAWRRTSARRPS